MVSTFFSYSQNKISQINENNIRDGILASIILNDSVRYSVYLPENYWSTNKSYPVLYLLHGYTDNYKSWIEKGLINQTLNQEVHDGSLAEMIVIMPDGGLLWYINQPLHGVKVKVLF